MATMDVAVEQLAKTHIVEEEEEEENIDQQSDNEESVIAADSLLNKSFPLKFEWGFYFLSNEKNLDWMERLSRICTLKSVEEFWAFIDRIRPPSVMQQCDYSLFKFQIQPVWEEKENKKGGRLIFQLNKQDQQLLNDLWLKLLLAMIGDYFGPLTESICGAVCSSRQKGSKISLWTTNAEDDESNKAIGGKLKDLWRDYAPASRMNEFVLLHYECHSDAQIKQSSQVPRKFVI